ncbi:MAG: YhbY family RNA-binding protein [Methanomassiliicoccus sp.]|nr:YhbY family RNA-binding protein [Methanomassiliicoccus sp.]
MPTKKTKKELVKMGSEIDPTVHVGKEGLTEGIVEEVKVQLKRAKLIKVRVLPAADQNKDEVAEELAARTGAKVVETRGFTVLLSEASLFDDKAH